MRIKKWFDHVSSVMSANGLGVMWMSPAGVPCRQPYKKHGMHTLQTSLQTISLARTKDMPVHKMRQRMGFPPNFIHSMDAAHMSLDFNKFSSSCIHCLFEFLVNILVISDVSVFIRK